MGTESRAERAARNEAVFRQTNENIKDVSERWRYADERGGFLCECSRVECDVMIELTLREYEAVRARGDRFFLVGGHDDPAVERVVEDHGRYVVVEKFGEGARIAEELDPRR